LVAFETVLALDASAVGIPELFVVSFQSGKDEQRSLGGDQSS
jgi:hypothetical protein